MKEKDRIIKKINESSSRPVIFNESFGGSESQFRLLLKYLSDEDFKDINLILNDSDPKLLEKDKINILWVHHFVNQTEIKNIGSKEYLNNLDFLVFNSNWNFEKYVYQFQIPESKSVVIKNAIEEINFEEKPKDKINLIYHTTPWRGLKHLINIFKNLDRDNVQLNVCSSTKIYGKKFDDIYGQKYEKLFDECKKVQNINYHGFVKNEEVVKLLKKTHIFSYPSTWPETSCVCAIEAMAAGCEILTTNLGAMFETCSPFGKLISFDRNFNEMEKNYTKILLETIDEFWSEKTQKKLELQRKSINLLYSWKLRAIEWRNFFNTARKLKR